MVIIVFCRNESCTAIFDLITMKWKSVIIDDGRIGVFGGTLVKVKDKLLYLGGSTDRYHNSSKDGPKRFTAQEEIQYGVEYTWKYGGLDEPSMRKIYEFNGYSWISWLNILPLPAYNNTVFGVEDENICRDSKLMTEDKFHAKSRLKPDRSMYMDSYSR